MPQPTATHIAYYHTCKRKLWLFYHGIQMEHTSERVAEGKLTGELSYPDRARKYTELAFPEGKIDFYDASNATVHEVKHSNKVEHAHIAQVKYYLYLLKETGVVAPKGVIEYPRLREKESVFWETGDQEKVEKWVKEVKELVASKIPPDVINAKICKSCSYHDFCYAS